MRYRSLAVLQELNGRLDALHIHKMLTPFPRTTTLHYLETTPVYWLNAKAHILMRWAFIQVFLAMLLPPCLFIPDNGKAYCNISDNYALDQRRN